MPFTKVFRLVNFSLQKIFRPRITHNPDIKALDKGRLQNLSSLVPAVFEPASCEGSLCVHENCSRTASGKPSPFSPSVQLDDDDIILPPTSDQKLESDDKDDDDDCEEEIVMPVTCQSLGRPNILCDNAESVIELLSAQVVCQGD
jgi:hypothetical protein